MPQLAYTYTLTNGTTADADQVMADLNNIKTLLNVTKLDADNIASAAITNALVSSSAAIDYSKLATLTAGNIVLGNSSNVATSTAVTGDIGITSGGVTSISSGVIVNADVNASAAIAYSKLNLTGAILNADLAGSIDPGKLTLADTKIIVGNGSAVGAAVSLSGDATIANTGALTIANSAVTTAKINDGAVTPPKLTNNYAFRAYRNAAGTTTLTANTPRLVNFNAESYDDNNNFDIATNVGRYTAPVTGIYHFCWNVGGSAGIGANHIDYTWLYKNGSSAVLGSQTTNANGGAFGSNGSCEIKLTANDYVEVVAQSSTANQYDGDAGGIQTWFSGRLVRQG